MVNQMSKFSPNLAKETHPLRDLLVKEKAWIWDIPQLRAFDHIKEMLTNAPVLAHFNPNQETILSADASFFGLGAVLLQRQQSGDLQPVAYISQSITPMNKVMPESNKRHWPFTWAPGLVSAFWTTYLACHSISRQTTNHWFTLLLKTSRRVASKSPKITLNDIFHLQCHTFQAKTSP